MSEQSENICLPSSDQLAAIRRIAVAINKNYEQAKKINAEIKRFELDRQFCIPKVPYDGLSVTLLEIAQTLKFNESHPKHTG